MNWIQSFLESQALLALFLTIALGYLLGEVKLRGLALGSGAVLFVGLAVGAVAPKAAPPGLLGSLGLLLFLYGVGLSYGKEFFRGLTSPQGIKANIAACGGVLASMGAAVLAVRWWGVDPGAALGMFAGSGTSTATLQAAMKVLGSDTPAVGYSVAYPFGVAGPILIIALLRAWLRPKITPPANQRVLSLEVELTWIPQARVGLSELREKLPPGIDLAAIRRKERNMIPEDGMQLRAGDIVLLTGTDHELLEKTGGELGRQAPGSIVSDRGDLEYIRVVASKQTVIGRVVKDLKTIFSFPIQIVHVRRGDSDLVANGNLELEYGDGIGVLVPPGKQADVRKFFGDSMKGAAEVGYITVGLGAALGLLLGLIPLPIPGVGSITLGMAGVLLFALWLGRQRRFAGLTWTMPLSANLVLRNFGLTIFLAQVGMSSGPQFVRTVGETGWSYLLIGAFILLALVLTTFLLTMLLFRLPYDEAAGVVCGATGNPAILAFTSTTLQTDRPDIAYAMIFPSMTVLKIFLVNLVGLIILAG